MEIIFHSHAKKTHFHKKGCAPSLIFKVRVFGTRSGLLPIETRLKSLCNIWHNIIETKLIPDVLQVTIKQVASAHAQALHTTAKSS